jgi:hypothetical protein
MTLPDHANAGPAEPLPAPDLRGDLKPWLN